MTAIGNTWRVVGAILTLTLFWLTFLNYLADDALLMAVYGFGGVGVFFVFWSIADSFDSYAACCTPSRPHEKQDYGPGQHWVTEDVR